MILQKANALKGEVVVPGDKSISHRAVMLGSLADGTTEISNFLNGADCLSSIACFRKLGIEIEETKHCVTIKGNGLHGLKKPETALDVGNSGTTLRLMSGILAAQDFETTVTGDASIVKRPMKRIIAPLTMMNAQIESLHEKDCAPLLIQGRPLKGIAYSSPVSSAQVKSAILLAGLYAEGETSVTEPSLSRNHTELMLKSFGAKVRTQGTTASVNRISRLEAQAIQVPGDISSAAYFIAAGLLVPNSELFIRNVGINPTRDGILRVCALMGANIEILNRTSSGGEETGDLLVRSCPLKAVVIGGSLIPALIDEIPILAVMACFANGKTVIQEAQELKVKESNRINSIVQNLRAMGANVMATEDGMVINGGAPLHGAIIDSKNDHRIAMSFAVAALAAEGDTEIDGADCVSISYPDFFHDLLSLGK